MNDLNNVQPRDRIPVAALLRQHFVDWRGDGLLAAFLLVLSILFTVSGAFVSAQIPVLWARLLYWWIILAQLYILYGLAGAAITLITGKRFHGDRTKELLASLLVPFAMAILGRLTLVFFADVPISLDGFVTSYVRYAVTMPVLVYSTSRLCAERELYKARRANVEKPPVAEFATAVAGNSGKAKVVPHYIEAENHTVKIVFPDRVVFRRVTLAQEVENWVGHGHQVHRSYWVSCANIAGRARVGRTLYIILKSGDRIPVGRKFERDVLLQVKLAIGK